MSLPIKIVKVTHGYNMFVQNAPVIRTRGKLDFDFKEAIKNKGVDPPFSTRAFLFKKASDVSHAAHQIGRNILGLAEPAYTYTELIGVTQNHDRWWDASNKEEE